MKIKMKMTKLPKARVTKAWLILVFHFDCWESSASFLDQSGSEVSGPISEVKRNQSNAGLFSTLNFEITQMMEEDTD